MFQDMSAKYGISIHPRKVNSSSLSFIMPKDGKRAIVRCRDDEHIHPFPILNLKGCRALHVDGHQPDAAIHYAKLCREDGILTSAFKSRIPVFCPDLPGSELSIGIARAKFEKKIQIMFDTTQDTMEMSTIAQRTRHSGIITLGNTASQNIVNATELSSYITRTTPRGHKYAISITTDSVPLDIRTPSYGGNHTSVFGKLLRGATTAYVPADPSIALPMIITALSQTAAKFMKGRKRPTFSFSGREMNIDVP